MKKFKNKIADVFNSFMRHPIIYSIMTLVLIIGIINLIFFSEIININENSQITNQVLVIHGITLENWSTIITIIGLYIASIWAYFQYNKSVKLKQQEKGAAIAQSFSNIIAEKITIINDIFSNYKDNDKIQTKLMTKNELNFNVYELKKLFDKKTIDDFNAFIRSEQINKDYQNVLEKCFTKCKSEQFPLKFEALLISTLNDLECLCISISSNAAGSPFIYNSMQAVFLNLIQQSYILIAGYNGATVDTIYINIIYVYNYWFSEKSKEGKKLVSKQIKIEKIKEKTADQIEKLSYKKPETV